MGQIGDCSITRPPSWLRVYKASGFSVPTASLSLCALHLPCILDLLPPSTYTPPHHDCPQISVENTLTVFKCLGHGISTALSL